MKKVDATVKRETRYIAVFSLLLSVLMQLVFLLLHAWSYKVFLGNLLSFTVAVLNFYFMGRTVQKAVTMDVNDAKKLMKASQSIRNAGMFFSVAIGALVPFFQTVAVIVPLFFPRIAIVFRPFIKDKKEVIEE